MIELVMISLIGLAVGVTMLVSANRDRADQVAHLREENAHLREELRHRIDQ